MFYGSSVPRNSAFGPETPVLQLSSCRCLRNAQNHSQTSFQVYWRQLGVFVRKKFSETTHSAPKHPFCTYFPGDGREMLQNTPKHRFRSLRELVVFVRTYFTEVRYPETVHSVTNHPFCKFFHSNGSEMLQNTPKHRLRSIGDNWVCSCEYILWKFGTPKQCIRHRYTRFVTFFMQIITKCYKTLPNIV